MSKSEIFKPKDKTKIRVQYFIDTTSDLGKDVQAWSEDYDMSLAHLSKIALAEYFQRKRGA